MDSNEMSHDDIVEAKVVEPVDTNDYKDLYGKLRNVVSTSKDSYKASLSQTKDAIAQREEELRLLKIRQHKLEGAIEASEGFLTAVLPNNNNRQG